LSGNRLVRTLAIVIVLTVAARASAEEPRTLLRQAQERFDFGDYEGVVQLLRPIVDEEAPLPLVDRSEALRIYGIACVLTGRRVAAEGAFVLLLRAEPRTELDPTLVRPEAVSFFEEVRARWRAELVAAYRRNRGKRYTILNFLPPAGQFQNHQRAKGYAVGAAEVALLATNITTGVLLNQWETSTHEFPGHKDAAHAMIPINIASFAALLSVVVYGIVDGLVVGHRLSVEERRDERRLMMSRVRFEPGSLALTF
jgi:hypothetical protein